MDTPKDAAKKLFFEYACNHFYMAHDGIEQEYRQFAVSPAEEEEWRREYVALWVSRLSPTDLTAVNRLTAARAGEALPALLAVAEQGDAFARLWYANALWDLATTVVSPAEVQRQAFRTAIDLWESLLREPIDLTAAHRAEIWPNVVWLEATTPEEYVQNYARRQLDAISPRRFAIA